MKDKKKFTDYKKVLETFNPGDIAIIKSILDSEGITYFFQGENFTHIGYGTFVAPARLMVKEDEVERAKEIIKKLKISFNFISMKEKSKKEEK